MPRNQEQQSSEKRGPGFVKLRRGLLPHLSEMSSNAVKLYVYLQLKAQWLGPMRGWVECRYEDLADGLGWDKRKLKRTTAELKSKGYIEVRRAANQHELTRIKILKYDIENGASAGDKSVPSDVPSNPSIPKSERNLQAPKNLEEVKNKEKDFTPLPP
jgi:hypothetical protein